MGREIKRVPLDFDWPQGHVWPGYCIGPHYGRESRWSRDVPDMDEELKDKWSEWFCPFQIQPPEGDGYQLWETVTEGSPISPVFDSAEGLARWMSVNRCTVTGPVPFETALKWISGRGWAPSMVIVGGETKNGIEGL